MVSTVEVLYRVGLALVTVDVFVITPFNVVVLVTLLVVYVV
jgi:hypothetical protein